MLSSEIATVLSGRYVEISMLPLSFKEYVESTGDTADLGREYRDYIENSSFPYALELRNHPKELKLYLEGIYNTVRWINFQQINSFMKDCLREKCWAKLEANDFFLHFGYDYYI